MTPIPRRSVLAAAGAALLGRPAWAALVPTPPQTTGPFYPLEPPLDDDNDLTRVAGESASAEGEVLHVAGRVLDAGGEPLAGARVEIWQANAHGRYIHPWDRSAAPLDPGFQGFGHALADDTGAYRFRTVRPGLYAGRTRHIHVRIEAPGRDPLVTQMYFAGEPANARDGLYARLSPEERAAVTVELAETPDEPETRTGVFDIVLN